MLRWQVDRLVLAITVRATLEDLINMEVSRPRLSIYATPNIKGNDIVELYTNSQPRFDGDVLIANSWNFVDAEGCLSPRHLDMTEEEIDTRKNEEFQYSIVFNAKGGKI